MSLISVDELTKRYGRVEALRKVSFKVEKGVTGLIGPNGAGKSTLIKILLGLITANDGRAEVFGLDSWKERSKILERVGVLHEKPRFPSWVTAREYLEYVARLKSLEGVSEEIETVSEICGLTDFIDRRIRTFSAGMVQRLGLADALIGRPELVILDEPTANLDPLGRFEVLTKIRRLSDEENINFLISTHILSELERVCEGVVILNQGLLLASGTFSELAAEYAISRYLVKVDKTENFLEGIGKKTVRNVEVKDEVIFVEVEDYEGFIKEVNKLVKEDVIILEMLKPVSATLEDIFVEVIRSKRSA